MPTISREDGERFVIPSYRDIISAKKKSLLKREILLLSANYGEYVVIQRKASDRYEVAFSPDPGYLLGETVWHYFKRPYDLIYCEAIPNTAEAILVIVKSGSVYLDGSFSLDSIPEELLAFKTQQNNFDIYVYGDVPISKTPEPGKFAFDPSSVHSFTELDSPLFPELPTVKAFQLQLVDTALREQGIGVFPLRPVLMGLAALAILWMGWLYFSSHKKELPTVIVGVVNPYQVYLTSLTTPDPSLELQDLHRSMHLVFTIPGWSPTSMTFSDKKLFRAKLKSDGARTDVLFDWARKNKVEIQIMPDGFYVEWPIRTASRLPPATISPLTEVIGKVIDRLSYVLPGKHLTLGPIIDRRVYVETTATINFNNISPATFDLLGQQFKGLPLVLTKAELENKDGNISGTMVLQALGS